MLRAVLKRFPMARSPLYGLLTRPLISARLRAALPYLPAGARVLDAGCGLAGLAARLPSYVGCDRNPEVLERNAALFPGVPFVAWDVDRDEPPRLLAGRRFDVALMLALLEHLADPARALGRVAGLLSPGGRIVATTPHPAGRVLLGMGARLGWLSAHAAEEHEALLGRRELEAAAGQAGLTLACYRRFLLGLNQLAVFVAREAA